MSRAVAPRPLARAALPFALAALALVACIPQTAVPTPAPATPAPAATPTPAPSATPSPPPSPSPSPSPTPTASPSPAPTPLVSTRGNVIIDQPRAAARVSSPLTVSGRARVFEAALVWRLVDAGGRELAKGFTTASAGAPELGTFSFSVPFTVTADTSAYLEVFTNSPRDGSIDEIVRAPITLSR